MKYIPRDNVSTRTFCVESSFPRRVDEADDHRAKRTVHLEVVGEEALRVLDKVSWEEDTILPEVLHTVPAEEVLVAEDRGRCDAKTPGRSN